MHEGQSHVSLIVLFLLFLALVIMFVAENPAPSG